MLLIATAAAPGFAIVMSWAAEVVDTTVDEKVIAVGDADNVAGEPVPVSETVRGEVAPELTAEKVAKRAPIPVGAKLIVEVQEAPVARLAAQVLPVMLKSAGFAPVAVTLLSVMAAVVGLVNVIICAAAVVPRAVEAKVSAVGEIVREAGAGAEMLDELPPQAPNDKSRSAMGSDASEWRKPFDMCCFLGLVCLQEKDRGRQFGTGRPNRKYSSYFA